MLENHRQTDLIFYDSKILRLMFNACKRVTISNMIKVIKTSGKVRIRFENGGRILTQIQDTLMCNIHMHTVFPSIKAQKNV